MYGWLFSLLPGPRWAQVLQALVIVAAVLALLFFVVFPWVGSLHLFTDSTIG